MTYPYGTKGAPAVGGGLPGLPRRQDGGHLPSNNLPDPYWVAIGDWDGNLTVVDLKDNSVVLARSDYSTAATIGTSYYGATQMKVEFSPDKSRILYCSSEDGNRTARIVNLQNPSDQLTIPAATVVLCASWIDDNRVAVMRASSAVVDIYSVPDLTLVHSINSGGTTHFGGMDWSRDGKFFALARTRRIKIYRVEDLSSPVFDDDVGVSPSAYRGCSFSRGNTGTLLIGAAGISNSSSSSIRPAIGRYDTDTDSWSCVLIGAQNAFEVDLGPIFDVNGIHGKIIVPGSASGRFYECYDMVSGTRQAVLGYPATTSSPASFGAVRFSDDGTHVLVNRDILRPGDGSRLPEIVYTHPARVRWADFIF